MSRATPRAACRLLLLIIPMVGMAALEVTITAPERALQREPLSPMPADPARAAAIAAGTRSADGSPGPHWWQNRATYDLQLTVDPVDMQADGSGTLTYHNESPDRLDRVELELVLNLHQEGAAWKRERPSVTGGIQLQEVIIDGRPAMALEPGAAPPAGAPAHRVQHTRWTIHPAEPIPPGGDLELQLRWSFTIPAQGAGGRMGGDGSSLVHLAYWYPLFRVYDDVIGWHDDPFLGAAEFHPPFGDHRVRITAPGDWLVVGTGTWESPAEHLSEECRAEMTAALEADAAQTIARPESWATDTGLAAGSGSRSWLFRAEDQRQVVYTLLRGVHWSRGGVQVAADTDPVAVDGFWRASAPDSWQQVVAWQQHALAFLGEHTGLPYPWPHMYAVEAHGIVGGGMEYPMATLILGTGKPARLYNITAHELAHMWYPMIVGMDERRWGWFDEGLATYSENQARRDLRRFPDWDGEAEERRWYTNRARFGDDVRIHHRSDAFTEDWDYFLSAYTKPSVVLGALRDLLGPSTWRDCLQTFTREWAWKHPYPADFFATVERISGRELDWFWRSWFLEAWSADHGLWDVRQRNGRWQVVVRDYGQAVLPAALRIHSAAGERHEITVPAAHWLAGHRFAIITLPPDLEPRRVELDPDDSSLDANPDNDRWIASRSATPPRTQRMRPQVVLPEPAQVGPAGPQPLPDIP